MTPFKHTNQKTRADLQVIQNKCLKSILNLPYQTSKNFTHTVLMVDKLDDRISKLCIKHIKNATENKLLVDNITQKEKKL